MPSKLTQETKRYPWSDLEWTEKLSNEQRAQEKELAELSKKESPMHASYVHSIVNKHLSDEDILVFNGGDFCHFGRAFTKQIRHRHGCIYQLWECWANLYLQLWLLKSLTRQKGCDVHWGRSLRF